MRPGPFRRGSRRLTCRPEPAACAQMGRCRFSSVEPFGSGSFTQGGNVDRASAFRADLAAPPLGAGSTSLARGRGGPLPGLALSLRSRFFFHTARLAGQRARLARCLRSKMLSVIAHARTRGPAAPRSPAPLLRPSLSPCLSSPLGGFADTCLSTRGAECVVSRHACRGSRQPWHRGPGQERVRVRGRVSRRVWEPAVWKVGRVTSAPAPRPRQPGNRCSEVVFLALWSSF